VTERSPDGPDSRIVEVLGFSRVAGERSGQLPLAELARLADSLLKVDAAAQVDWAAQGYQLPVIGGAPEVWLHLQARTAVELQCQRCLQPMQDDLQVDRRFRFVRTEAEAVKLDEASEDDVLVLTPRLDLTELIEDELILALPIVPMHAACPEPLQPAPVDAPVVEDRPNPFAALAALRKKSRPGGD
jgi:uncharacterized protein